MKTIPTVMIILFVAISFACTQQKQSAPLQQTRHSHQEKRQPATADTALAVDSTLTTKDYIYCLPDSFYSRSYESQKSSYTEKWRSLPEEEMKRLSLQDSLAIEYIIHNTDTASTAKWTELDYQNIIFHLKAPFGFDECFDETLAWILYNHLGDNYEQWNEFLGKLSMLPEMESAFIVNRTCSFVKREYIYSNYMEPGKQRYPTPEEFKKEMSIVYKLTGMRYYYQNYGLY